MRMGLHTDFCGKNALFAAKKILKIFSAGLLNVPTVVYILLYMMWRNSAQVAQGHGSLASWLSEIVRQRDDWGPVLSWAGACYACRAYYARWIGMKKSAQGIPGLGFATKRVAEMRRKKRSHSARLLIHDERNRLLDS